MKQQKPSCPISDTILGRGIYIRDPYFLVVFRFCFAQLSESAFCNKRKYVIGHMICVSKFTSEIKIFTSVDQTSSLKRDHQRSVPSEEEKYRRMSAPLRLLCYNEN